MIPRKPERLADLFGCDLAGWQIAQCHFLELAHGLMGTFPAITVEGREVVAVLDKSLLRQVWDRLEQRQDKVTSLVVVMNPTSGIAFSLENYDKTEAKPFRILTGKELDALCQKQSPFEWAPGLFGGSKEPINDPVFV